MNRPLFKLMSDRRIRLNKISHDIEKNETKVDNFTINIRIKAFRDYLKAVDDNWESDLDLIERFKYL